MTEASWEERPEEAVVEQPGSTGNATVDSVLEAMDGIESAPVDQQVRVFESAHERLRAALADAGDAPTGA